jgi:hypothetical protein
VGNGLATAGTVNDAVIVVALKVVAVEAGMPGVCSEEGEVASSGSMLLWLSWEAFEDARGP